MSFVDHPAISDAEQAARLTPEAIDAWRTEHGLPPIDRSPAAAAPPRGFILDPFDPHPPLGCGPHC